MGLYSSKVVMLVILAMLISFSSCKKDDGYVIVYGDGVTDIDNNTYVSVIIGNQEWMAENLRTTRFNDGTSIPLVSPNNDWSGLTTPAYSWYDNDNNSALSKNYGALYNWYTVETDKLCPTGWHVPTGSDWDELKAFIANDGIGLKDDIGWHGDGNGHDTYGFSASPGGYRSNTSGAFHDAGTNGTWWSNSEISGESAKGRSLRGNSDNLTDYNSNKSTGFSIRCIKD